ncbi:Permease of the drug/metabolite transporter (DMT) superfamily [Roseovarius marisflavi]|uniref:Permease of the drug/metabolite transporter (DMT) superfamily n=1 Tax=Roseovarius marisflavi TaxID=1054996 RepID=A0A1M6YQM0_9RHOB|nr:DMT family transporter [Roseovarius marisflavi]SHL20395.1 Permease of the drug/metabolite transporter (DMT) superfamily [Roseovarius marisflavi]
MSNATTQTLPDQSRILLGASLAWVAVIIYASSNSLVSLLADIGSHNRVMGRNVITYCNLLFVGSLMSMVPMVFMFWRDWTFENLRALTAKHWVILTLSAFLSSALTPGLFFYALEHTSVTNVVLMGRIEPPLFLLATYFLLREEFEPWSFAAGLVALCGAALMIALKSGDNSFVLGKGEIGALLATLSYIASTLVARTGLRGIPLGIFSIYRTAVGTTFYFFLAIYLFGPKHFQDVFHPIVWQWVWIYALIVVIGGQFAWALGLKYARSGDVSLATSFSPLAAILIAMLMLGEDPGPGLIPGGAIILLAVGIGQYGRIRRNRADDRQKAAQENAMQHEGEVNFKGA